MGNQSTMANLVKESFRNKRVFISGHTGFKGVWLTQVLLHMGAIVKGYSLEMPSPNLFNLTLASEEIDHVIADIRDKEKLKQEITNFEPDYLFHLAAQSLVIESYHNPLYTFEVNQMGTAYILESLRHLHTSCTAVIITTDKVYRDRHWQYPYRENDILGGYDPYSASKATCELVVESYRSSFFNPLHYQKHQKLVCTARAGNVIGGGDFAENRLLPDIFKAFARNESVVIRNPGSMRPWQHVLDALYGYLLLAAKLSARQLQHVEIQSWNFGPELWDLHTVEEVVKLCVHRYGSGEYELASSNVDNKETTYLCLDISKSKYELGWKPKWNLEQSIARTVDFQKHYVQNPNKVKEYLQSQINEFLET
ncbi:MAG: CDP-glucose 4,6-dehydratase [Bacteroidota bacterium]